MKINKRTTIIAAGIVIAGFAIFALTHGGNTPSETEEPNTNSPTSKEKPMNISIFLDLSDRLVATGPNDNCPQMEKDTAIIGYVQRWFIQRQYKNRLQTGDRIQVLLYPNPDVANIANLQKKMMADFKLGSNKAESIKNNKKTMKDMPQVWANALSNIYGTTISTRHWVGSDVWGFFDVSAKRQCIKKGYRNILIILTDGYLYYRDTWQMTSQGTYTGITPRTADNQVAITPIDDDLSGLEVLFMEINPKKPAHFGKIRHLLTEWCKGMGIEHVDVVRTDLPALTQSSIDNFLDETF